MKKGILAALVAVVVVAAVYLLVRQYGAVKPSGGAVSSVPSSAASASSALSSAPEVSPAAETSSAAVVSDIPKEQAISLIQKAIDVDWKKYTLKPAAQTEQKTVNGKKYQTFLMWDEDYQVGPAILVDPADGKVYTWTETDPAPVLASEDKAFDKTEHTITGTVTDGAMMSVLMKTADGRELTVRRLGIDTSGLKSLNIGDKIRVTYTGVINGSDMSRAFVTKLESAD